MVHVNNGFIINYVSDVNHDTTWTFAVSFTNTGYCVTGGLWIHEIGQSAPHKTVSNVQFSCSTRHMRGTVGGAVAMGY